MRPIHHREPGPAGAALAADLACEVINDGVHVHPAITALVNETPGRLVLVTDAIDAAGMGDGEVELGGQRVAVRDGRGAPGRLGSLAGSTLTMDAAVRRAVLDSGLSMLDASAAASGTPARLLGVRTEFGAIDARSGRRSGGARRATCVSRRCWPRAVGRTAGRRRTGHGRDCDRVGTDKFCYWSRPLTQSCASVPEDALTRVDERRGRHESTLGRRGGRVRH